MPNSPELFPTDEPLPLRGLVAERELIQTLRLSRTTLWRLRVRGMPTVAVGRSIRYDLERVRRWLEDQGTVAERAPTVEHVDSLPDCHWQLSVALDPKHRPQEPSRPASTVRREWWRYPQEAHLLDRASARYRRLNADEIRALQGFPEQWGGRASSDELLLIRGYGDAVPPILAERLFARLSAISPPGGIKTSIEICAGFGGMALGKTRALEDVHHLALIERWPVACEVLRSCGAFPPEAVQEADLNDFPWAQFAGHVDLFSGGPPCQPWSVGGQGKGEDDERDLLGKMPEVVAAVRPKVFVFENVPGLLSGKNEPYARELIEKLRHCGGPDSYGVAMGIFNAADFGVAQTRRRVFIVGAAGRPTRDIHRFFDLVHAAKTHANPRFSSARGLAPWVTLAQAIPDWHKPKAQWRTWPQTLLSTDRMSEMPSTEDSSGVIGQPARRRIRVGLDWPSRGLRAHLSSELGWQIEEKWDDVLAGVLTPLLPSQGSGSPIANPWYVMGEPMRALEALRRVVGRSARLVYIDVPRIKTNAGSFDAAERETVLDTWLTVVQGLIRRAYSMLRDDGVLTALCGIDETHFVRLLLDEIAGPGNHVGTVAWQKNYSPRNMPGMKETSPTHDNIVIFARRMESLPVVALKVPPDGFANRDNDPRGAWNAEQKGANKPDCDYEVNVCPYRWSISAGQLPPGVWRINPKSGVIWAPTGGLTEPGEWSVTVTLTDEDGHTVDKQFAIAVSSEADAPELASIPWLADIGGLDRSGDLRIVTTTLPPAKLNAEYSACIVGAGGTPWAGTTRPGKTATTGKGRYWEFPLSTLLSAAARDAVDFKNTDNAIPALKNYLNGARYTPLNQTSVWFGSSKNPIGDVGYSQEAKKELEDLVKSGAITGTIGISKPARLMSRLLALFSSADSIVVDVGSPASEMASIATQMGRRAMYVELGADEEIRSGILMPRLALASSGQHPLPDVIEFLDAPSATPPTESPRYFVEGCPRPQCDAVLYTVVVGRPLADLDVTTGTAAIDYAHYPPDSSAFRDALASLEGLAPDPKREAPVIGTSLNGSLVAVHVGSGVRLDRDVIRVLQESLGPELRAGKTLRIYYHRGNPPAEMSRHDGVEFRRIPFEMNFAAGLA